MSKLEQDLEALVRSMDGGGFGCPDAKEQFERRVELLKFKITRRDNMRVAVVSALIGAVVAAVVTIATTLVK